MPKKWMTALAVTFGALMAAIDSSIMYLAIPHLRGVFSATTEEISWVSTGYLLGAAATMPAAGWVATRIGRRNTCLWALLVFTLSSLACGLAPSLPLLIAGRIVQGVAAGVLTPLEQVILRETFPPQEQAMAMSLYGVTIMAGPALGPVLAGYLIDAGQWPWVFYINVPIGLIGMAMVHTHVHDSVGSQRSRTPMDWGGMVLLVIGFACLLQLLEQGERSNWLEERSNVALLAVSACALMMFVAHELQTDRPLIDLRVAANKGFASAMLIGGVVSFAVYSTLLLMPIFMQDQLGFTPTKAGACLLIRAAVMMVAFPVMGKLYAHVNPRLLMAVGLTLCTVSSLILARLDLEADAVHFVLPLMLQGIAIPMILTPLSTIALQHVDKAQLSAAASLNNVVRQLGGSLGISFIATLLTRMQSGNRADYIHAFVENDWFLEGRISQVSGYFFSLGGMSASEAASTALKRFEGRFLGQVNVISINQAFLWTALMFIVLLPLLVYLRKPTPTA